LAQRPQLCCGQAVDIYFFAYVDRQLWVIFSRWRQAEIGQKQPVTSDTPLPKAALSFTGYMPHFHS
jgi:hypothetical protein